MAFEAQFVSFVLQHPPSFYWLVNLVATNTCQGVGFSFCVGGLVPLLGSDFRVALQADVVLVFDVHSFPRYDVAFRSHQHMGAAGTMTGFTTPQRDGHLFVQHPLAVGHFRPKACHIQVTLKANLAAHIVGVDFGQWGRALRRLRGCPNGSKEHCQPNCRPTHPLRHLGSPLAARFWFQPILLAQKNGMLAPILERCLELFVGEIPDCLPQP